ncbi:DUF7677 family protein [Streptomyces sp. ISL-111]|uniref:DUF7677 family protein n=1 Tax=Streptomyces sp. ISL-111 TaxID=2819175 RepID=UPI003F8F98F5
MVFAVFSNVLEVDEQGRAVNDGDAQFRVAQWIRARQDPSYVVDLPFEPWETELHRADGRTTCGRAATKIRRGPPARSGFCCVNRLPGSL